MNKQLFIDQLNKLVGFKTITGSFEENSKALDYVESLIKEKSQIKRVRNGNAEILLAANKNILTPDFCYLIHMDVVAAEDFQFKLDIKGDRAYGRGASDMKFSIPIGISILNYLIETESDINFTLAITTDEEIGGFEGGYFLAENMEFKPKCLIVPDGGDNLSFVNKAKGVCQIILESDGIPAHASKPWMGESAIEPLIKIGKKLIDIYSVNSIAENWNTTLNFGQILGGQSINQVCDKAVLKLDFRYPEDDSIENIKRNVENIAMQTGGNIKISLASTGLPTFTDPNNPLVVELIKNMTEVFKKDIQINPTYGASDARHFAKMKIPVLMIKPMGGEIHSKDEWISIDSSLKFYKGLKKFLTDRQITIKIKT